MIVGKAWTDGAFAQEVLASKADSTGDGTVSAAASLPGSLGAGAVEMPEWGSLLLQFGLALVVVVVLILVLQRVARRFGPGLRRGQNSDEIQVHAQRSMGQKLSLAIVEVDEQRWLVSISPQGIQRVADISSSASLVPAPVGVPDITPETVDGGVGGLTEKEISEFEEQLKSRMQTVGGEYSTLRDMEARS